MVDCEERVALRKFVRLFTGFSLLGIGLVGLIMPIMPGWVFIIPGLIILADYFPPIRRLVNWAKRKATGKSGEGEPGPGV